MSPENTDLRLVTAKRTCNARAACGRNTAARPVCIGIRKRAAAIGLALLNAEVR